MSNASNTKRLPQFAPVPGFVMPGRGKFEATYYVTPEGNVLSMRTANPKYLTPIKNANGYLRIRLQREKYESVEFLLHELIARVFLGPKPDRAKVRFKDGNRENCALTNIEYVIAPDKFAAPRRMEATA